MEQFLNMFGGFKALLDWGISYLKKELPTLEPKIKAFAADKLVEGKVYSFLVKRTENGQIWVNFEDKTMTAVEAIEHILELVESNKQEI